MSKKRQIFLIGYRATGKSTIGFEVSRILGWNFIDLDRFIEEKFGQDIRDIFKKYGEDKFRDLETEALEEVAKLDKIVVSTGGGVILRGKNRDLLKQGIVILLKANIETIISRLKSDNNRPPLTGLSLEEEVNVTLSQREKLYDEVKDLEFLNNDIQPKSLAQQIVRDIQNTFLEVFT